MTAPTPSLSLKIEFGGGLELLFGGQRMHRITIPTQVPADNTTAPSGPSGVPPSAASNTDGRSGLGASAATAAGGGATKAADVEYLIHYMRDCMLTERPELFMEGSTVRPGILVLINDTDWELEGEGECALKDGDEVVFISTLHGG